MEIQQRDLVSEKAEVCKDAFIDRRHKQIEYTDKNEKTTNCNKTNLEQKLTGLHEQRENKIAGNFNYEQFSEPKSATNVPDCNTQQTLLNFCPSKSGKLNRAPNFFHGIYGYELVVTDDHFNNQKGVD